MIDAASARRFPARDLAAPDPLSACLSRISWGALLTQREEVELGRRVRAGARIACRTLIERNLRLVVSVAVRYRRCGVPLEDLIQEGNIGLMEAVERFDPERGYRFSSYAVWRIREAIQKAAAAQSRTVRVPRRKRDRVEALGQAHGELRAELGREPDAQESASRLGWTIAEVRATMGVAADARSLDQPYGPTEDAPTLAEFVADESAPEIPDTVVRRMELDRIRRVVEALPARARYVVVRRYGLDGREPARLAARGQPATAKVRAAPQGRLTRGYVETQHAASLRHQGTRAVLGDFDHHNDAERDQHERAAGVKGVPEPHQQRKEQPGGEHRAVQHHPGAGDRGDHHREQQ